MTDTEKQPIPDIVPGTIQLVDVLGTLNVKKDSDNGSIILQPQPTNNINDPLRWSKRKRHFQFFLIWLWCFFFAASSTFYGPLFGIWLTELNTTYGELTIGVALIYLFLGSGVTFVQPTALKLGKRFVYLTCTLFGIIGCTVGSLATTVHYFYIYQICIGIGAAPVDTLAELTATDLYFQSQRATAFGMVILALYAGCLLGPVACGYISDGLGWRWCFKIQIIIYVVMFVVYLFILEETSFRRDNEAEDEFEKEIILKSMGAPELSTSDSAKKEDGVEENIEHADVDSTDESIPKNTYKQRMKLIHLETNDPRPWYRIYYRPFLMIRYPAAIWGGVVYGSLMMWLALIVNSVSRIYGSKPYNYDINAIGLTNLGSFGGSVFGILYGGFFVDWSSIKLARRNHGVLEPEYRLYSMIVPTIVNAAGLLAYGLGSYYKRHWAISVIIGQGFLGFTMGSTGSICLTYAVDCYHKMASESIVFMLVIRNMIGMIFCFVFVPWLDSCGLKVTTWIMFGLSLLINGGAFVLIKWGKDFRRATADRYARQSDPEYRVFKKKSAD
ncbi:hypothetical protein JA1_004638 [Spathaspora sp. JA1]|nr:hypothetical protein JA1_004638 [Spathaspora sp. JA1]